MEVQRLKEKLEHEVTEPRWVQYGNIQHKLADIVIIGLCTVVCGGEDFSDMEAFGKEREQWLRNFLDLPNGIPDSDTFRRPFERLDPQELSQCLRDWLGMKREERSVIAVDGKTIRGSGNGKHKAYHVVSAFVAENQITLGELVVEEKTNEITAVPELLDMIDVNGAIVTADAMSCQKAIAEKISTKKADYVLALKENQPCLLDDARRYFEHCAEGIEATTTLEKGHGRIEKRTYRLLTSIEWLEQKGDWCALKGLGEVESQVTVGEETTICKRYYITSLTNLVEFTDAVRKHWSIENQLHWNLDVIFREDASRSRKDKAPLNMNILRKEAMVLLNQAKYGRLSKKRMMFKAALNPEVLLYVLFGDKK